MTKDFDAGRLAGLLFIVASAAGFGAIGIFARIAYADGAAIPTVLFLRFGCAALFLFVLCRALRLALPTGRDALTLALMGGVGYVLQTLCFFQALRTTSVGLVTLLLYLYPALVTLVAALRGRCRLTPLRLTAIAATLCGLALSAGAELQASGPGILLGLAAAVIYTTYILVGEPVNQRVGAIPAATVVMAAAALVYGVMMLVTGPLGPQSLAGWGAVAGLSLFSTVIAMVGFFAGMQRLGAADASALSSLEPVFALALAALFLGEIPAPLQIGGALLVVAAVIALARSR